MKRCVRCVIPDTRPDTPFTEDGLCAACVSYDKRDQIDWTARAQALTDLLSKRFKKGAEFDCIVPSSGGKDSHWQVMKLIGLGARPLVVTATTCHLTDVGRRNIDNLARYATTIEVTPNRTLRAFLNRQGLEIVGDISWPEHVSIFTTPFKVAERFNIPLLFYGENPQEAYGGPEGADQAANLTLRWRSEYGGFLGLRPSDMVGQMGITERDMADYELPADLAPPIPPDDPGAHFLADYAIDAPLGQIEAYFLGQYLPWDSHENAAVAIAAGMADGIPSPANWWPWENLDNAQTGIHDHLMYRKYGYGRGAAQISVDVRAGLRTREEAIEWCKGNDGRPPMSYMGIPMTAVLDRIGMTSEKFWVLADRFTNWGLFDKDASREFDSYPHWPVLRF